MNRARTGGRFSTQYVLDKTGLTRQGLCYRQNRLGIRPRKKLIGNVVVNEYTDAQVRALVENVKEEIYLS